MHRQKVEEGPSFSVQLMDSSNVFNNGFSFEVRVNSKVLKLNLDLTEILPADKV